MDRFTTSPSSTGTPVFRIPGARTPIVGRHEERIRAAEAIRRGARLITLVGTGGVGKTRLALAVAEDLKPEFGDRVGWVSLGEVVDPDLLLDAIARSIDITLQERDPLDTIATAIGNEPAVLVIDNMEHLAEVSNSLGALLERAPALALLVTSRLPLRLIGERELRVEPFPAIGPGNDADLETHPAIQLFVERARAVDSTFVPDAAALERIASIVARIDYLPLAIELAAVRIRHFPLEEIASLLSSNLDLLTGGPRDAPDRQRTIRAAIGWSYDLLHPAEQRLFRTLSVFPGPFTLERALHLAEERGSTRVERIDLISGLVDQNLLIRLNEPGATRYAMLSTIRAFGQSELIANGEDTELRLRFAESVLERVRPQSSNSDEDIVWLESVERSMDDVRASVAWAIGQGNGALALSIISALANWWTSRGTPREAVRLYDQAFPLADGLSDEARFPALGNYAWVLALSGETERALALRPEILALSESIGDAKTRIRASNLLGALEFAAGNLEEGRAYTERGLEIADAAGLSDMTKGIVFNLATFAEVAKDYDAALAYHHRGLARIDRERNPGIYGMHLLGMASLRMRMGDLPEADRLVREVWPSVAELRVAQVVVGALNLKGELLVETGDLERAARLFGATDRIIDIYGRILTVLETAEIDALRARLSGSLDPAIVAAATAAGQSMDIDDLSADMLRAIDVDSTPPAPPPSVLTPRETDVARLLVEGQTNPEIAEALFISERTVQSHVANIMAKLDVRSRTAAAARVVRDGLLA